MASQETHGPSSFDMRDPGHPDQPSVTLSILAWAVPGFPSATERPYVAVIQGDLSINVTETDRFGRVWPHAA